MLSLFCGNRYPPPFSGSPLPLAQFAELFLIKRFRSTDSRSDSEPLFIGITSERLSTFRRNRYRHQIGIPIAIARNPHEEHVQDLKADRRNGKEVYGHKGVDVVVK